MKLYKSKYCLNVVFSDKDFQNQQDKENWF